MHNLGVEFAEFASRSLFGEDPTGRDMSIFADLIVLISLLSRFHLPVTGVAVESLVTIMGFAQKSVKVEDGVEVEALDFEHAVFVFEGVGPLPHVHHGDDVGSLADAPSGHHNTSIQKDEVYGDLEEVSILFDQSLHIRQL